MDDLISRQAAIEALERAKQNIRHNMERAIGNAICEILDEVENGIKQLPSAQPEIVQCKDCTHWDGADTCDVIDAPVWDNDFCSFAEKRSDEE